ncbi:tail collar domain [Collimonas sp. PA-H2]|uniref:phage tail-collar fiber domain-containing protein n=1 Tax=Collimonas sp. PA-H2 TaxID=1881062 RepID=UPI000BFA7994|nr:phage tail protein [Collimonas sp. PA-H2]PFH10858.1 tail collar domain [Collimonas sp. PA-H2]
MSTYFATLTAFGEAKLANASALGTTIKLTHMGVGDAYDKASIPDRKQTMLLNERRRAPLNRLAVDPANPSQLIVEQVLPENVGGWWIREIGVYDEDGYLCAVANCPPSYKPQLSEGSGRTQVVRLVLLVSSTSTVELKIDPAVVLATRSYAEEFALAQIAQHESKSNPHAQYNRIAANLADVANPETALKNLGGTPLALVSELSPCGEIAYFATTSAPVGWLKANGALVSRATYAALFRAIGTRFGAGDGAATFAVPDLRGEFMRGLDDGRGIDGGRSIGSFQSDELRSHSHLINTRNTIGTTGVASESGGTPGSSYITGFAGGTETRPRNIALLVCIKY